MSRLIDADAFVTVQLYDDEHEENYEERMTIAESLDRYTNEGCPPTIDAVSVVRCKDCKHRPIKEDVDGENYGFNLIEPNDGDERCPCLVSDGWYSWMPNDNFYCGYGERKESE